MKYLINFMAIVMFAVPTMAEEKGCPAAVAAERGFTSVEAFHHAVMPLWHTAWPEKDFETLIGSGMAFDSLFGPIAELKPVIGNKKRLASFTESRKTLGEAVSQYTKAVKSEDGEKLYEILPGLHDAFESMASSLIPTPFPHFEGLVVTSDVILTIHLPNEDVDGITGSTETLVLKLTVFDSTMIPEELNVQREDILKSFSKMSEQAGFMKKSCDAKEMKTFAKQATEFSEMLKQFSAEFL